MPDKQAHIYDIQTMTRDVRCRHCGHTIEMGQDATVLRTVGHSIDEAVALDWAHPDCVLMSGRFDVETGRTELQQFLEHLRLREIHRRNDAWWEAFSTRPRRRVMPARVHDVDLVDPIGRVTVQYEHPTL